MPGIGGMLEITLIMNSSVEEVLAFKTCCGLKVQDQNLEIHLKNNGEGEVAVRSRFELVCPDETLPVENLMPQGVQTIEPGQIIAFYCYMDETVWERGKEVVFFETDGTRHIEPIPK